MQLSARQRRALEAICDTFAPGVDGAPSASAAGVPDTLAGLIGGNPRKSERSQVGQLLGLWDTPVLTALGGGGFKKFTALSQEERERVLLSWAESRLPQRRAAFQALRKGTLLCYYGMPGPDGRASPQMEAIGYPGPLGKLADAPPKELTPLAITGDTTLECDVVVVGSGAGGGTAAGVLAGAGLDVVVLEAGDYYAEEDFDGAELPSIQRMYLAAPAATADQSVGLVAGSCLGGGTVVNYTTSFRTPDEVRSEWAKHGVTAFRTEDYGASLDAVCERLGVNQEHSRPSSRDRIMQEACVALGWHVDAMPRNVRGCDQGENCGFCGLGCRLGAKMSVTKTWLSDAAGAGARLVTRTRARAVTRSGGAASGVEAVHADGHRVTVKARAVVVACGALHTPALLRRSGLQNDNIGQNLRLHPATAVFGVYDEDLRPWEGTMQALYSDEHRDLDGAGYGVKYETAANHPHIYLTFAPWRSGRHHFELTSALGHTSPMGVLLRDRDGGEVKVGRDGEPIPRYRLSDHDRRHLRKGVEGAARMHEAAGARKVYSAHTRWVSYRPGAEGDLSSFMAAADAAGYGTGDIALGSFHIMGTARMGGSPATSACDPSGQTWDVRNLVVADASCFPTASGVNPMISIEAIAHMNARRLAERLGATVPAEAEAA